MLCLYLDNMDVLGSEDDLSRVFSDVMLSLARQSEVAMRLGAKGIQGPNLILER